MKKVDIIRSNAASNLLDWPRSDLPIDKMQNTADTPNQMCTEVGGVTHTVSPEVGETICPGSNDNFVLCGDWAVPTTTANLFKFNSRLEAHGIQ